MLSSIIPEIRFDFNFDFVLLLIFVFYLIYGYLSGGHKQIRLSINLILPFVVLYYLGRTITQYIYTPLTTTFFYELISEYLGMVKNVFVMVFAYMTMYVLIFIGVFIISIFARRYVLNENMRAKLGRWNNVIGAMFSFVNGYVLVYFIILPAFSFNIVGTDATLTNFVLENPPPFSRIARTAEKAVPIKGLTDKANNFEELLSVDGIEGYYNEAIYDYQLQYVGGNNSYEAQFMDNIYDELTQESRDILDLEYFNQFGETLSSSNYYGVSYVLLLEESSDTLVYEAVLDSETEFTEILAENKGVVATYNKEVSDYEDDLLSYAYNTTHSEYEADLETYVGLLETYLTDKLSALKAGNPFTETFTERRPIFDMDLPDNYDADVDSEPIDPDVSYTTTQLQELSDAQDYIDLYEDKEDIRDDLRTLGKNFEDHKGLLVWYVEVLANGTNDDPGVSDISTTIVSFKTNYEDIVEDLNDEELEDKLYLAMMSIRSYDVFTIWLEHTQYNIDNVVLEDIELEEHRCPPIDVSEVVDYDFTDNALDIVTTLFEGEAVSWIITQFKYDYEAGVFEDVFEGYDEVNDILLSTKGLVDEYDLKYKDIATSIDGNISMIIKIGISVIKFNLDVYDTLENTPLIAAAFNDLARFCPNAEPVAGYDVEVCARSEGEGGMFGELLNMRYLISEVFFKAYFLVDNDNVRITYDSEEMHEYLDKINGSVEDGVISDEVIEAMADQFAFNVIDETNGMTLLEQMFEDGYISIEAMRVMADDEHELFSDDFRARVRSLIR